LDDFFGEEKTMGSQEYHELLNLLLQAQSGEELIALARQHPKLLSEEFLNYAEQQLSQMSPQEGRKLFPRLLVLESIAWELVQDTAPASHTRIEGKISDHISPEPSARWARLTRQYLALRKKELLQQAVETAEQAGEMDIAKFLRAFQAQDFETINRMALALHLSLFCESRRAEEAWTVALVHLDIRARLTEGFIYFPLDQQMVMLEVGLEACEEAAATARTLGDEPCTAVYRAAAGNGYYRARRFEEAEGAYREALGIYRRLADEEPQVYEPNVATTLNNLGNVLRELRRFEEAEGVYREALEIRRRLAKEKPQVYEPDVAMTLNNLGAVLSELRRLEEAEGAFREALGIRRRLAEQMPQVYEPDVAGTLNNLGNVLRELRRFEEA
jgi:tetratricopeptide (TPR) repeat protein